MLYCSWICVGVLSMVVVVPRKLRAIDGELLGFWDVWCSCRACSHDFLTPLFWPLRRVAAASLFLCGLMVLVLAMFGSFRVG